VSNQALPKKLCEELKKVYDYLRKRNPTSNSDFKKRKIFNVTIATMALILLSGFMLVQVMSAIQVSNTISNTGTLRLSLGIGVYQDAGFTDTMTAIDWGSLAPRGAKTYSVYIRNEGISALTLSMSVSNWNPSSASNYLTLTWNYDGQTINAGEAVQVTFTLTVSANVTGISNFSFNINLVGSG